MEGLKLNPSIPFSIRVLDLPTEEKPWSVPYYCAAGAGAALDLPCLPATDGPMPRVQDAQERCDLATVAFYYQPLKCLKDLNNLRGFHSLGVVCIRMTCTHHAFLIKYKRPRHR